MPEITLLPLETSYPCPVKMIGAGGEGRRGVCAMEVASVLFGDLDPDKFMDRPQGVNPWLRRMVIAANDMGEMFSTDEERADALWPFLPALAGSAEASQYLPKETNISDCEDSDCEECDDARFPLKAYLEALGLPSGYDLEPDFALRRFSRNGTKNGLFVYDKEKALHGLKLGVTVFWSEVLKGYMSAVAEDDFEARVFPQPDFTPEQIDNLNTWLVKLAAGDLYEDDYDPSLTIRQDA
jgi:hypothetical protein